MKKTIMFAIMLIAIAFTSCNSSETSTQNTPTTDSVMTTSTVPTTTTVSTTDTTHN